MVETLETVVSDRPNKAKLRGGAGVLVAGEEFGDDVPRICSCSREASGGVDDVPAHSNQQHGDEGAEVGGVVMMHMAVVAVRWSAAKRLLCGGGSSQLLLHPCEVNVHSPRAGGLLRYLAVHLHRMVNVDPDQSRV